MKSIENALKILWKSRYLAAIPASSAGIKNVELLREGEQYAAVLQNYWERAFKGCNTNGCAMGASDCTRTGFASDVNFITKVMQLQEGSRRSQFFKTINIAPATTANMALIQFAESSKDVTHLICDFLLPTLEAVGKFYSWQRERKIWWMRLSANPGRYFVEPYDLETKEGNAPIGSKSITIKSKFDFGSLEMENITLVPISEALHKLGTNNMAVIRSRIQLESASCALLLDGTDHSRMEPLLLLSRSLAPCQCAVVCFHAGKKPTDDLRDLCLYINIMLRRVGIRTTAAATSAEFASNLQAFNHIVETLDCNGIPYCLIVEEQSLENGLLELRSRDTTLQESIHISDLPTYLLDILQS